MPKPSTPLDALRGKCIIAHDGTRLFQFFRIERLEEYASFLSSLLPEWWTDNIRLIGNLTCGDTIVVQNGVLFLIDHDTLDINRLKMTELEFFSEINQRNSLLDKLLYSSIERDGESTAHHGKD